uniref:Uncharacterized protein n=1 Tax=uncultured marine virus TaxID=186617 RepID=A0A0F7L109_9VIRU|nr:hypothetical protein [uncultured marine virus]
MVARSTLLTDSAWPALIIAKASFSSTSTTSPALLEKSLPARLHNSFTFILTPQKVSAP